MELRGLHPSERPRERLGRCGPEALRDEELLALLLRSGIAGKDALGLAQELLRAHPGGVSRLGLKDLRKIKGLGAARAAAVVAAFELARRETREDWRPVLDSPERVMAQVPPEVLRSRKEQFLGFFLNARSRLVAFETISVGTLSASLVHPREVFAPALSHGAAALIIAHNHPSGDARPSPEDKDTTSRLTRCGQLMGIPLLDHVIVAEREHFSFREQGLLS